VKNAVVAKSDATRSFPVEPAGKGVKVISVILGISQAFQEVQDELASVRHRLAEIESALGIRRQENPSSNSDDGIDFRENGLAGTMEEAALGIGQNRRWHGEALMDDPAQSSASNTPWFSSVAFSDCLSELPTRHQSHILLEAYCDRLNWIFGCLHRVTLYRHHATFWSLHEQGKAEDSMTLALLFAVLSVSAFFFEDYQTYPGMPNPDEMEILAHKWFDLSLATFFRCEGMTKPTLTACNTILALFPAFNLSGNTPIHASMMQLLIGIGRSTNLHLLGNDNSGSPEMILNETWAAEPGGKLWKGSGTFYHTNDSPLLRLISLTLAFPISQMKKVFSHLAQRMSTPFPFY
ncbi:unnamed protein product, partial [Clonostachys rosea f. rosea IK726]